MRRISTLTMLLAAVAAFGSTCAGCGKDGDDAEQCDGAQLGDRQLPLPLGAWWRYGTAAGTETTITVAALDEQLPDDWTFIGAVTEACDKREKTLIRLDVSTEQDGEVVGTATRFMTQDEVTADTVRHTDNLFGIGGTRVASVAFCPAYTGNPDNKYDGELMLDEEFLGAEASFPKALVYRWFERTFADDVVESTVEWEVSETWMPDGAAVADEEVTVPAGTFECKKLVRTQQFELIDGTPEVTTKPDREQTMWFASGVGLVKVETTGSDDGNEELLCWGD